MHRASCKTNATTSEEIALNWNKWIRLTHRWLSIAFTAVVIVNGVAVAQNKYTNKLGLSAVFVLALQFFTGLYLFVLPYVAKWRSAGLTE
jgi:hypothetical protein